MHALRELQDHGQGRVPYAPLDPADVGPVELALESEPILRKPPLREEVGGDIGQVPVHDAGEGEKEDLEGVGRGRYRCVLPGWKCQLSWANRHDPIRFECLDLVGQFSVQ